MRANQTIAYIVNIALLSLLLGACSEAQKLDPLPQDAVILAFGDSLTAGKGASRTNSYPGFLARKINRKVINAGINGEISSTGLKRLPALLDKHQPDMLILCHGGNDVIRKLDMNTLKANLKEMIEMAQARNIQAPVSHQVQ